jgi:tetratricopeptide (TPR) repeat protein
MHEHLTRELFRAVSSGWRNPGDLAAIALAHLYEQCPSCRREYESWRREAEDAPLELEALDYGAVIERIRARVEPGAGETVAPIDSEIEQARTRAEEVLRLDPAQRAGWIRFEAERFSGSLLAEVLIEESRRRTPTDPRTGYTLADLARLALQHAPASLHTVPLYARALAYMANAVRVIGDLPRADQLLGDAHYLLRSQGGGDRLVRAELDSLEGSLRIEQDRPEQALPLILRALMTYHLERAGREAAATLIKLARTHSKLEDLPRSLVLLDKADEILGSDPEPWLQNVSLHNRAGCLMLTGEPELAQEALDQGEERARHLNDPLGDLRRLWVRALLARRQADLDSAEQLLVSVRRGFSSQGLRFDAALASLDLGWLVSEQGRLREAGEYAEEILPVFEELRLPAKAAAARGLRAQAARA